jgi:hypothetical protein
MNEPHCADVGEPRFTPDEIGVPPPLHDWQIKVSGSTKPPPRNAARGCPRTRAYFFIYQVVLSVAGIILRPFGEAQIAPFCPRLPAKRHAPFHVTIAITWYSGQASRSRLVGSLRVQRRTRIGAMDLNRAPRPLPKLQASKLQVPENNQIETAKRPRSKRPMEIGPWSFSGCWLLDVGCSPGSRGSLNPFQNRYRRRMNLGVTETDEHDTAIAFLQ